MSICEKCGSQTNEGASFCTNCGAMVSAHSSTTNRKSAYGEEMHKCPNCGEVLKAFEAFCPCCKFELRGAKSSSAVKELIGKIDQLDLIKSEGAFGKRLKQKSNSSKLTPLEEQKISLISNFLIPNTKEDILEFMILASSHIVSEKPSDNISEHDKLLYEELKTAWKIKFEQAYEKAKICIKNESDRVVIEQCYNKTIVVQKIKRKKRKRNIIISLIAGLISLILIITSAVLIPKLTADPNAIEVGISYKDVKGQYYEDVMEIFEINGFINIEAREDGWSLFHKSGTVKSVTINGKDEFYEYSTFSKDAKIIILYYS